MADGEPDRLTAWWPSVLDSFRCAPDRPQPRRRTAVREEAEEARMDGVARTVFGRAPACRGRADRDRRRSPGPATHRPRTRRRPPGRTGIEHGRGPGPRPHPHRLRATPGLLRMRGALAADAQCTAGAVPTAQPFTRTTPGP